MTISNEGETDAVNTAPIMPLSKVGTSAASLVTGPIPASVTITAGSSESFTFIYQASAIPGTLAYNGKVQGFDARTGMVYNSVTDTSNTVMVESPAVLVSEMRIIGPSTVNTGQLVTVVMRVTNTGAADAVNVSPNNIFATSASTGGMIPVEPPVAPLTVSGTASGGTNTAEFTWVYSAAGTGTSAFSCNVTGYDENSGNAVISAMDESNYVTIQVPAAIIASINAAPSYLGTGSYITVVMEVVNIGLSLIHI